MARPIQIQVKKLRELQAAIKAGETALDPRKVTPILLSAVDRIRVKALENLRSCGARLGGRLPLNERKTWFGRSGNQRHIEDVLVANSTKRTDVAKAWTKVRHYFAPQGIWLEFGHRLVAHGAIGSDRKKKYEGKLLGGETRKFPFFRPAVDSERAEVRRQIRRGLQELCKQAFGTGKPGTDTD